MINMILEIKGKEYELNFGIKFIKKLDNAHFVVSDGMKFGVGIEYIYSNLASYNPLALVDVIVNASNIKYNDAVEFVENEADIDGLFDDFLNELRKGRMTQRKVKEIEKNIK